MFKNQFMNATNYDPAIYDMDEGCAYKLGYETNCLGDGAPRCRLCASCAVKYKRKVQDGMARCNSCPEKTENTFLLIAGFVVVLILLFLLIRLHLQSGGKRTMAEMYQVIIINYLQLSSLTAGMDVPWPDALGYVFDFQGIISTIGEHLLSPDCELQGMRASDLLYSKQVGYVLIPWMLGLMSFIFWRLISLYQGKLIDIYIYIYIYYTYMHCL